MSSYNRHSYLGTLGDYPIKTGGEVVILPGKGKHPYNVLTGELVVWNPRKNKSLNAADIATEDNIAIAVGIGNPGEMATDLLHLGGNNFNLCDTKFVNRVTTPKQGTPQIVDVLFNDVECGTAYGVNIRLDDSYIRSTYGYNEKADYAFEVSAPCGKCSDCDDGEFSGEDLACLFVDAINETNMPPKSLRPYFQADHGDTQYKPFKAVRLFGGANTTQEFCLAPQDGACVDCDHYEGIKGIKIDGNIYTFTYTVNPKDNTKTLPGQLERIVEETNRVFEDNDIGGHAVLIDTIGKCFGRGIQINSCETGITYVLHDDSELSACNSYDPMSSKEKEAICKGCGVTPETVTFEYGFRIIVDHVEDDCNCDLPPNERTPNYYGRTVDVQFTGDSWRCFDHWSCEAQEQELPEGFGYFYQDQAHYKQDSGGRGRDWRNSNRFVGRIGLPDKWSRASNAINNIKCDETYCVYSSTYTLTKTPGSSPLNTKFYNTTSLGVVLIPSNDTTTQASFEEVLEALSARGVCTGGTLYCNVSVVVGVESDGNPIIDSDGGTLQLTVTIKPSEIDSAGTWESSNDGIATVGSDGKVTAVANGEVTITYTNTETGAVDSIVITITGQD